MSDLQESPSSFGEYLKKIFPDFCIDEMKESEELTFHHIMREFTYFFGKNTKTFSEKQLRAFGNLINSCMEKPGKLENAISTCFLEHLHQIKANNTLRSYLNKK